ncbi:MAG: beta strand repeat-containing protein, partial [Mycobacterium sp.]
AVLLDAGTGSTITIPNITTTGGNLVGTGIAGAGGNITFADAVLLPANRTLTATGGSAGLGTGGNVNFQSTVDSFGVSRTLAVNTGGTTTFGGVVGGTLALTSLTTDATGTTAINTTGITTTGAQSYGDAVTLGANATLASTGGGAITFSNTVDGAFDLAVNTTGATTFTDVVGGGTALASLTTNAGGTTAINGGAVTTTGAQSYGDNVTLGANATLASTANGDIAFAGTLNSAAANRTLAVNTGGTTTFGGIVGGTLALTSLTTDATGTTAINTTGITTTGAQSYGDAVTLGANATLASTGGGAITFSDTVNGAFDFAVNTTGTTTFTGAVGGGTALASLTTNAGGTTAIDGGAVTTTGAQAYNDNVTLGAATVLTTTDSDITATGAVSAGGNTLTLVAGAGNVSLANASNDFGTVAVTSANNATLADANAIDLGASTVAGTLGVTAAGAISDSGNLSVTGLTTLTAGAGNNITLDNANDFSTVRVVSGNNVALSDVNAIQFSGASSVSGTLDVTAVGISQAGGSSLDVSGLSTLAAGAGSVVLNQTNDFSTVAASGINVVLTDSNAIVLGTTNAAANLVVTAGGNVTQSGVITVAGAAQFNLSGANTDVLLGTQANNIGGAVAISPTGFGSIQDVSFRNVNAGATEPALPASFRNYTLLFDNTGVSLGARTLTGDLAVTTGGAITQGGALAVTGTSSFDAGANAITLTNAANDFTGAVSLSNSGANNATVNDTNDLTLGTSTVGGALTAIAGGTITLGGNLTAGGAGDSLVLAAGANFDNAGGFALNPGPGRYLVWSTDPASDNRGGLAYNFKQYNATYGVTGILGSGNGFLYTLAPVITPSLIGTVNKVYDGTTAATLAGANYSLSGAIDGDTVTLNNPAAGVYDTRNVGINKDVSVSGIAIGSATNGAATIYGYTLSSSSANASIGVITQAALALNAVTDTKVYDGTTSSAGVPGTVGLVGGD